MCYICKFNQHKPKYGTQGSFRLSMWSRRLRQLFLSENTSASLSNVCFSFFDKYAHVLLNLDNTNM